LPNTERPLRDYPSELSAFAGGVRAVAGSVLTYTLFVTYIGVGALAHDLKFTLPWTIASTLMIWAAPAQIIFLTSFAAGATVLETALAVTLSAIRLMPMVVALLPMIRTATTKTRQLILPMHFTAVTVWVESFRLLPAVPRQRRIAYVNGLGAGLIVSAASATAIGYGLAANLPPLLGAAVLFLTPMSFLVSTARNSRMMIDRLALVLGLVATPAVALMHTGVDVLLGGCAAGTLAYAVDRWRRSA
jgi:predicted branched-subunit amino acid permease